MDTNAILNRSEIVLTDLYCFIFFLLMVHPLFLFVSILFSFVMTSTFIVYLTNVFVKIEDG